MLVTVAVAGAGHDELAFTPLLDASRDGASRRSRQHVYARRSRSAHRITDVLGARGSSAEKKKKKIKKKEIKEKKKKRNKDKHKKKKKKQKKKKNTI